MMRQWGKCEWWPKAIAINRVVSSMGGDYQTMQVRIKNLLARIAKSDWQNHVKTRERTFHLDATEGHPAFDTSLKTFVLATDWLIWCRGQGFTADPALWNALDGNAAFRHETEVVTGEADIAAVELNLQSLDPAEQDYIERKEKADRKLVELNKKLAALMGQSSSSLKRTPAQKRQVNLIKKVRELMQHELDTTWPEGQRGLKMHVIRQHYPALQRIYSYKASAETMAGKTKPSACEKLDVPRLPA